MKTLITSLVSFALMAPVYGEANIGPTKFTVQYTAKAQNESRVNAISLNDNDLRFSFNHNNAHGVSTTLKLLPADSGGRFKSDGRLEKFCENDPDRELAKHALLRGLCDYTSQKNPTEQGLYFRWTSQTGCVIEDHDGKPRVEILFANVGAQVRFFAKDGLIAERTFSK
jgi:hypothetical protein